MGREDAFVGIVGRNALGAQRAWRFADAVWKMSGRNRRRASKVMLDCAITCAARLEDERIVLTEFIVDMGFALAALGARGTRVGLTVLGKAGGGVYVALAAPARRVASVYGAADIQVLPGAAVAAILGESRDRKHAVVPGLSRGWNGRPRTEARIHSRKTQWARISSTNSSNRAFPKDRSSPLLLFDAGAPH